MTAAEIMSSRSSTPPTSSSTATWRKLNFRRLKSLRSKTFTSCEDDFVAGASARSTNENSSPNLNRRKLSFRNRWRSRKNVVDDGPCLRRSQSAKEVRGSCTADIIAPCSTEPACSDKQCPKKDGSSANIFGTFRLKRTRTLSSIVATWNKSIRISKRKSQSFRHLENFFSPFEQRY